jgi:hypothetical protein
MRMWRVVLVVVMVPRLLFTNQVRRKGGQGDWFNMARGSLLPRTTHSLQAMKFHPRHHV